MFLSELIFAFVAFCLCSTETECSWISRSPLCINILRCVSVCTGHMIFLIWDFQRHPKLRKDHFAAHLIYTHVKETCSESWYLNNSSQSIAILQRDIFVLLDFKTKFNKIYRFSASLSNFFKNYNRGRELNKSDLIGRKKIFAWIFLRTKPKKGPAIPKMLYGWKLRAFPCLLHA